MCGCGCVCAHVCVCLWKFLSGVYQVSIQIFSSLRPVAIQSLKSRVCLTIYS